MQCITVGTPPQSLEQVDAVLAALGSPPEGMEARFVGRSDDGELRIVTLWESKEHAERFFADQLAPVLARTLGPEPAGTSRVIELDVVRRYERQPVG
ncbi:hypothetical protein [Geodermatophilus sp. URMC 64]